MKRYSYLWRGYLLGFMVALVLTLFYQDYHGQEGYIERVKEGWLDVPWPLWVVVLVIELVILLRWMNRAKREDKAE